MAKVEDARNGGYVIVKVGDVVSFKSDIEQSGRIKMINGTSLVLEAGPGGFQGGYIGGQHFTTEDASDCWVE